MVLKIIKKSEVQAAPVPAPKPTGKLTIHRKPVVVSHSAINSAPVKPPAAAQPVSPLYVTDKWYPTAINCTRPAVPLDNIYREVRAHSIQNTVAWFLMASYCYYVLDHSLLSDGVYDEIAQEMRDHWDELNSPHKSFIKPHNLQTGSMFDLPRNMYPSTCVGGLTALIKSNWGAHW